MLTFTNQRGDTIIEVLLAITIFSMVSVGAMTIMNQGTNTAQRALEITQVRQQIDAQAEALRAVQQSATFGDAYADSWNSIVTGGDTGRYTADTCPADYSDIRDTFIMNARKATKVSGSNWFESPDESTRLPYARVDYDDINVKSFGIWIERRSSEGNGSLQNTPSAYNFTIKACWSAAGMQTPQQIETVVRLYDPTT